MLVGIKSTPISCKIQVTYPVACRFVSALGYLVDSSLNAVNFLALEGARPHEILTDLVVIHENPHALDVYNDSLIL